MGGASEARTQHHDLLCTGEPWDHGAAYSVHGSAGYNAQAKRDPIVAASGAPVR